MSSLLKLSCFNKGYFVWKHMPPGILIILMTGPFIIPNSLLEAIAFSSYKSLF